MKTYLSYLVLLLLVVALSAQSHYDTFTCAEMSMAFPNCICRNPVVNGMMLLDTIVDCSNLGLTDVPQPAKNITRPIKEFLLQNNSIRNLGPEAFNGIQAASIDLRGNLISTVDKAAFNGTMNTLRTLYLQGETNTQPPKEAFQFLGHLEELTLSGYNVTHLHYRDQNDGYPFGMFLNFINLKRLTLDNWKLEYLDENSIRGPTGLEALTLKDNNFYGIPVDAIRPLKSLKKLTITGNRNLKILNQYTLGRPTLSALQELDLSNNEIEVIDENAFSGMDASLQTLRLSDNVLRNTAITNSIKNLGSLRELDLSSNADITVIPSLTDLNPNQPITLDLKKCAITQIRQSDLAGISAKLLSLDLSYNKLRTIEDMTFQDSIQLQHLDVSHQRETSAPLRVPSSLSNISQSLQSLALNGQGVDWTSLWAVVSRLTKLQVLDLTSTDLTNVPQLVLEPLTQLKDLRLGYNFLSRIDQTSLVGPRSSLQNLNLAGNQLTTLSMCVLHQYNLSKPLEMTLNQNNFQCNCSLQWLKDYARDKKIVFSPGGDPSCQDGQPLLNKTLDCSQYTEPACIEYYQTTPAPTGPGPTEPSRVILSVSSSSEDTITVSWNVVNPSELLSITVEVLKVNQRVFYESDIPPNRFNTTVPSLLKGTTYTVCVTPVFPNSKKQECTRATTLGENGTVKPEPKTDSGEEDVGIIVGSVVAGVLLLVLLGAIIYLVFLKRKPKPPTTSNRAVQPRTFTKQELPTMAKPKEPMQVVAISDGMTNNSNGLPKAGYSGRDGPSRVGRAHLLTSEGSSYAAKSDLTDPGSTSSTYENDRGPLPNTPKSRLPNQASKHAYYNDAFNKYDEINHEVSF